MIRSVYDRFYFDASNVYEACHHYFYLKEYVDKSFHGEDSQHSIENMGTKNDQHMKASPCQFQSKSGSRGAKKDDDNGRNTITV